MRPTPHRRGAHTGNPERRRASTPSASRAAPKAAPAGLLARQVAADALWLVMVRGRFLEEALTEALARRNAAGEAMETRDRSFVRLLVTTVLRRHGELGVCLSAHLEKPLPDNRGQLWQILLCAAAQLLLLETPAHAAIGLAVDQCKADPLARRLSGLANAVLRRVAADGPQVLAGLDRVALNVPGWLLSRWEAAYGRETAHRIAAACLEEPPLDLSVKGTAGVWAETLGGHPLPQGSIRLTGSGRIPDLPGFTEGAWWVQDAAAALPARLLDPQPGQRIADLCAAPGGKTAQLAAAGAKVSAIDISPARLERVRENLERLGLTADLVAADASAWTPDTAMDAVLIDAPCSATGTVRRHPDILHVKQTRGLEKLAASQARLLDHAARLVRPGGCLVYCTCSLEPEEGEHQIRRFLMDHPDFSRSPITAADIGGLAEAITPEGDLRTLPHFGFEGDSRGGGMDGFFAARLRRNGF